MRTELRVAVDDRSLRGAAQQGCSLLLGGLLATWLSGCGVAAQPVAPSGARSATPEHAAARGGLDMARARCQIPVEQELEDEPAQIEPDERVPDFLLASERCEIFDSRELVGKQPFVVVFFASWCSVCEHKLPLVRDALEQRGEQITSLFVSLDETNGWEATERFLARNGLVPTSAVAGRDFLSFSLGYNPFRSVPVVVVVGRSGHVVDVQVGVRDGDEDRLDQALDVAIDELPEGSELTFYQPR
jgi:thiol-disulfide isomerase/thioredoxin